MMASNDVVRGHGCKGPYTASHMIPSDMVRLQEKIPQGPVAVLPIKPDGAVGPVEGWHQAWLNGERRKAHLPRVIYDKYRAGGERLVNQIIAQALAQILGGQDG